ncbi:MAG: GntR family transcriptional regulator [Clostridia bacterium]|nr:GntR family transcriptional regulator [Clostridia bacterium]
MLDLQSMGAVAPRTVGDSVYEQLREAILSMRLKPGENLNIKDIAETLNISRSPVRDALMRLSAESLVEIYPQRGCRVSPLNLSRIQQEQFFREGLEIHAITEFIPVAAEEDFVTMQNAIGRQAQALAEDDYARVLDWDFEFHKVFFEKINQMYSLRLIEKYCVHYQRFRLLSGRFENNSQLSVNEHIAILQAARERDIRRCIILEKEHMHHIGSQQKLIASLEPDYFE